jgi:hypothetical protein
MILDTIRQQAQMLLEGSNASVPLYTAVSTLLLTYALSIVLPGLRVKRRLAHFPKVVALTEMNASKIRVPTSQLVAVDESYLTTQSNFLSIVAELTVKSLLSGVSRGMRVLV